MKLSKQKELNNLKKIIIFFPIFNKGGIEIIACDLIKFFLKKNIKKVFYLLIPESQKL